MEITKNEVFGAEIISFWPTINQICHYWRYFFAYGIAKGCVYLSLTVLTYIRQILVDIISVK